jgi:hypothetical protein
MAARQKPGGTTVSITHPDGIKFPFTENLVRFLLERPHKHKPFFLGQWLESLGDAQLDRLASLAEQELLNYASDAPVDTGGGEDLMGVVVHALAVETRNRRVSMEEYPAHLGALCLVAALEEARRAGWITLKGVFSLADPARGVAEITEKGMREMPQTLKRAVH